METSLVRCQKFMNQNTYFEITCGSKKNPESKLENILN